jgi:hypothetical protein
MRRIASKDEFGRAFDVGNLPIPFSVVLDEFVVAVTGIEDPLKSRDREFRVDSISAPAVPPTSPNSLNRVTGCR